MPVATAACTRAVLPGALPHPTRPLATQVVFRALSENPGAIDFSLVPRAILGLVALLCGNGYIVGINQVRTRLHVPDRRRLATKHCYRGPIHRSTTSASTRSTSPSCPSPPAKCR